MWKSHEFFNIHTIVENLSIKYQELESSYYSFLRKSHKENERILQQEANLTSQFFHNLLREQSLLETNIKQLASEGQVFNDQISQLKAILSQEQTSPTEAGDPFRAYNHYLNTKFNSLKTKVLAIPDLEALEMSVLEKIDFHFQEAIEDVNATFSQLSEFNKETVGQSFDWRKIEEVINTNLPSFTGLEISLNSIKAKVIKSFGEFDTFTVSYNKEATTLRETIDQIKSQIFSIAKDAKSDSLRPMSPGSRTRGGDDTHLSNQVRKSCTFVSQLLTDSISNEQNRNRLVNSIKEEMRTLRDDIKHQLHEISKHVLFLKGNNQRMTITFEEEIKAKRARSVQEDSPGSRTKSTVRTARPNVTTSKSASALNEKKMNLISPSKTPNSILSVNSPLQAIIQNNNLRKHSHTVSGGDKFYQEHGFGSPLDTNGNQLLGKTDENFGKDSRADYELIFKTLGQKFGYLETSVKNMIVSSGKVASFFVNFTGEEELALRVYESDKRSLESSVTSFKGFIMHTYDSIKTGSLATRSVDQDNGRRKEQSPLSTFSIRSPMRVSQEDEDKHILIEDSQEGSPGKKRQYAINDFQNAKKGGNKGDSPGYGALSEEARINVRALSSELVNLKSRYESVSLERDQLKKENTTLNGRLKASVDSSKYELTQRVEDLTVQKENLTKENLKLLKVVKKLHRKAEDRKKNLKQLFELMTEKEKELEQYKSGKTGTFDSSNREAREEAVLKQQQLEKNIKKKEKELKKLEETIAEKKKEAGSAGRSPGYGAYTSQIAELDERKQKLENVLAGLDSDAGAEVDEIQEMISLLSRERDLMVDKARTRIDPENWSSQQKDAKYGSLRQEQALKATIQQQEEAINILESEKKDLEAKCQEFMSDIESAQDHKKRIEKTSQEEIRILTNKLQELNNYIQELETKNTQRLRGSLGSDKWKTAMAEDELKDENKRLKHERETVVEALQGIIEDLEVEGYTNWDGYEALKKVHSTLAERIEEDRHSRHGYSSARDNQLGSYRSTERGRDTARKEKAELEELIENLKDDLKQTADSNKKILTEVENLKQEASKYKTRSREYSDVLSRVRSNLEKHGWIERGYQNEDANQRVLLAVETVVSEYDALRKKKGGEEQVKRSKADEPDNSRRLLVEKDKKIVDLNNELHETQERLAEIEKTLIPSKEKIIKELREEVHGKNNEIHVLKNTIAGEKEKTILGLRDDISDKNKKIHELQERLQNMISINERKAPPPSEESQETIQLYLEQNEQLRSEVAKINERLIGVNQHLDQMRQHNTQLMEEKRELEKLLQTNKSDQRRSSREYSEQILSTNLSNESRGGDTRKLQAEKTELEKQVFQISGLLEGSKADVMRLSHENKALHKELAAAKERKNSIDRPAIDPQVSELKDLLAHKTSAYDKQAKELEQVKKQLKEAKEQLDDLKAMDFNIKGHAEKVEEDLRRSEEKWLEMENTLEQVAREKEELSEQLTNLRQQVEEQEDALEAKHKQIDGLKATVKEIEHLKEEARTQHEELVRSQARCTELEKTREELLEKVKGLKKEKEIEEEQRRISEGHVENLNEVRGKILEYEVKIGDMREDARIAQEQKENLLRETEQLREAYNRLQTRLEEKEGVIEEKEKEIQAVEIKYDKLKREYEDLVFEFDGKKRDLEGKEKEVEKAEKQYNALKEEFLNVKNELQRANQDAGLRDKELSEKETQYKKLEVQYNTLKSQLEERVQVLEIRETEYNKLREAHERVGADAEKGKQASSALERQMESDKEAFRKLQADFSHIEKELKEKTHALEESHKQVEHIREQYEQLKVKYNEVHKEFLEKKDALEVTAAELGQKQIEYEELEKVYTQLESSLSDNEKAKELIHKEKEHKEREHTHLKEEFNKLQLAIREKEHVIESRDQDLEEKNKLYSELEQAYDDLLEQVKVIKKSMDTKDKELEELNIKYNKVLELANSLRDELQVKTETLEEREQEIEGKVKEVEEKTKELNQLKGSYNSLKLELENKTTALENVKEDLENLEKTSKHEISILKAQFEHNEQHHHGQIKEIRDENTHLQHSLQAKEQEVAARDIEVSGLKRKVESLQGEITLEKQRRDELEIKHREELEQVEREANERVGMNMEAISEKEKQLKDKNKEAKKKIAELQEENDDLQGQIRGLKVDLDNLGQTLSGKIKELSKGIQEANHEYERMKTDYEKEIEEKSHRIAALEGEISTLKDSVREKEQEIVAVTRRTAEEANKAKSEYEGKINGRNERIQSLESEVENLKESLQNKKKELSEAIDEAKRHAEERKNAHEKDVQERNTRIAGLEGEIDTFKTRLAAKESEITELTGQVSELKKSKTEINALYEQTIKSSETASNRNNEKINLLESQIAALKKDIEGKNDEITNLKKSGSQEITQIREDYEGRINSLRNEIQTLNDEIANLKKSGSQEITQIREDYESRITSLKSEIETLNGQVASNKALSEEHLGKLSALQTEHNELTQKFSNAQASLEAAKTEADKLRESLTQKNKESEEMKVKIEELSADRETLIQNVQELTSIKADKGTLEAKYQAVKEEKRSLERTASQLKQDLNNLTSSQIQHDQKTSEDLRQKNAIISSFSESFEELQKSQILKGKIDSRFQDKSQVGEAIQILRASMESKDEEIKKLTQELQNLEALKKEAESSHSNLVGDTEKRLHDLTVQLTEKFNKEREDLQSTVKVTKEDMEQRLLKLSVEIEDIIKSATLELSPINEELKPKSGISEIEKTIHDYLSSLKTHIGALEQVKKDYKTTEEESKATAKQLDELRVKSSDLEKLQQALESEKKELQTEIQTLKENYKEREGEIEKLRETLEKKANKEKPSDFDLPSVDITEDFDENQIKKLMEDTFKVERKGDDRSDVEGGTQNIKYSLAVQEEIRELKEENERLDLEYRQLRSQHDLLLEVNEELKSEVNEKEDEVKKMEYQMTVLKDEFAKMEREKNQTTIAHEKQHIRMMFIKFMESALAGTKEAPELLKYLLALLDLSEANKNQILENFKAKTAKKTGFKVFSQ